MREDLPVRSWTRPSVNFSDATVAIAITLMILPLVDAAQLGELTVGASVDVHGSELFAFFLSFWIIARYWMIHHRVFELVRDYSQMLIWLNTLWLATVVFIPFAQSAISVADSGRADLNILYVSCLVASARRRWPSSSICSCTPTCWTRRPTRGSFRASPLPVYCSWRW